MKTRNKKRRACALHSKELEKALADALSVSWDAVKSEMRGQIYCGMSFGPSKALVTVTDGCSGEDWWTVSLGKLVSEFIDFDHPTNQGERDDVAEWTDRIASDFEKQARRLRARSKALRTTS